ncbi:hypothetical protein B0H10DRAFT_2240690 [Mycena sp. CBHHK59/15]|nr:hypothetical protein B0H10DRAFT_2240690 [Mycena sp. CBHHK59/15]
MSLPSPSPPTLVPAPLDSTASGVMPPRPRATDHHNFQSVLLRLAPPRLPPVGFGSISRIPHSLPMAALQITCRYLFLF